MKTKPSNSLRTHEMSTNRMTSCKITAKKQAPRQIGTKNLINWVVSQKKKEHPKIITDRRHLPSSTRTQEISA